ncbi:MAG TPA: leucine-rich repeat domain-containing protein [Candidatus Hydrogenedentes bacterium]|nr:leucine-rich repeat domain-containing protein [Candidatus Hydrogenedentota bacterium]HOS01642.1 leucine-rich repeat domain-containing protein [Candidatus Hydrogenedentota bacterium]
MKSKWHMRSAFGVVLMAVMVFAVGCPGVSRVAFIKDPNLDKAVRLALDHPLGFLTEDALLDLRELTARDMAIADLTGLEKCVNLTYLDLSDNEVSDIRPLANLTSLMTLNLDNNRVFDLSPLAGLINLDMLSLFGNPTADIQALVTNAANGGLGPGDSVVLEEAQLSDQALLVDVPALQASGINVILAVSAP